MALLARFFEWRQALTIVKPDTLIRWHRKGFRLFWYFRSLLLLTHLHLVASKATYVRFSSN
jgi:hypothetical protein